MNGEDGRKSRPVVKTGYRVRHLQESKAGSRGKPWSKYFELIIALFKYN